MLRDDYMAFDNLTKREKEILQNLSASLDSGDDSSVYGEQREPNIVLLILVSSNRGLCGAFNANVIKLANKVIEEKYQSQFQSCDQCR